MIYYLLTIAFFVMNACGQKSVTVVYNASSQENRSEDFEMFVNNKPVFVYRARVSKYPVNQIWPGYQRPVNQTEISSFATFDFNGEVEIKIQSSKEIHTLDIRPTEYRIKPSVEGHLIKFKLSEPSQIIVEVNGYHQALQIFANPIETFNIDKQDPKVHYFGPGLHDPGVINLKSNETVFIDGGATVHGVITSEDARNIKILGRGILDASQTERGKVPGMITLKRVVNATISGIILRDSPSWAVVPANCDSVTFNNIKLTGMWRYNSDGIDIINSKNITVRNSFIRAFDDNIVIKGSKWSCYRPYNVIERIRVDNCVLWNDWGRAIEIGAETVADTIKDILFSNCYIPHFTAVAMDIQDCDRGYITDIHFDNISIEDPVSDSLTLGTMPIVNTAWGKSIVLGIYGSFYSNDSSRGNISNIYFNNIRYNRINSAGIYLNKYDSTKVPSDNNHFIRDNIYFGDIRSNSLDSTTIYLSGFDSTHQISNIYIKDYFVDGVKVLDMRTVGRNKFVRNVSIH
jgi:hypothetical protein